MTEPIRFTKMHGAGNDYIYVNTMAFPVRNPEELAIRLSAPHTGIGSDGLILIKPSEAADCEMDMYNLGANMGMYFMYKNREQTKVSVQGTYLNEYLISQPLYELTQGYIPLLFWQFVPPVSTIDRIKRDIQKVVDTYEKGVLLENKTVHVNARIGKEELVQELKKRGFRFVTKRIDKVEELWNLSDGINSPCEEVVQNIVEQIGVRRYKELCENALYLDLDDLKQLVEDVQGLIFQSL